MAKVTSKRQLTIPKAIADRYRIREGDDLEFVPAGDAIRLVPASTGTEAKPLAVRLELFDAATERQRLRDEKAPSPGPEPERRGWTREELYTRGRAR